MEYKNRLCYTWWLQQLHVLWIWKPWCQQCFKVLPCQSTCGTHSHPAVSPGGLGSARPALCPRLDLSGRHNKEIETKRWLPVQSSWVCRLFEVNQFGQQTKEQNDILQNIRHIHVYTVHSEVRLLSLWIAVSLCRILWGSTTCENMYIFFCIWYLFHIVEGLIWVELVAEFPTVMNWFHASFSQGSGLCSNSPIRLASSLQPQSSFTRAVADWVKIVQ